MAIFSFFETTKSNKRTFLLRAWTNEKIDLDSVLASSKFYMFCNSVDSKFKNNILAIVWFSDKGRSVFLESKDPISICFTHFYIELEHTVPL